MQNPQLFSYNSLILKHFKFYKTIFLFCKYTSYLQIKIYLIHYSKKEIVVLLQVNLYEKENIHFLFYFLLILAVGSIPFTKFLLLPITLLLFLNFIVEGAWKKLARLKNPKVLFHVAFRLFYLLYCVDCSILQIGERR